MTRMTDLAPEAAQEIPFQPFVVERLEVQRFDRQLAIEGPPPSAATLGKWFSALGQLQRKVAGSRDFFVDAAHAICDPGGLDQGAVLHWDGINWHPLAVEAGATLPEAWWGPLLHEVTTSHSVCHAQLTCGNSEGINVSAIAAPIFSRRGELWGVVYGLRHASLENRRRDIRPLEAWWVQLVAEALTNGVARLEIEEEALKTRLLFAQAFAPQVIQQLERDPYLLEAREQEVTVLFCDLRGFSQVAARLAPRITYELLSELLEMLTYCVTEQEGVIVDYYGDGLEAIWNAPVPQSDHAFRACQAAWEMQLQITKISDRWQSHTGQKLRLGCGVHTGVALIGNAGTRTRLKYGPRGVTVNLASRLEAATKVTGCKILTSESTWRALPAPCCCYRVAKLRIPGSPDPVDTYAYCGSNPSSESKSAQYWIETYSAALNAYERADFAASHEFLDSLPPLPANSDLQATYLRTYVDLQLAQSPSRRKSDRAVTEFEPVSQKRQ